MRLISAQVTIKNDGTDTVTVDSLVVELFRAQNMGPQRITALAERWDNAPVPADQQVPPVQNSLLRESPRYWYTDPQYDQCCDDSQLHVPYTAYTFLVAGYVGDVRFGGTTGPGWALAPGATRSSWSIRVVLHDSDDSEHLCGNQPVS